MKSLAIDHLPLIASAPDGVKKLRELILQLAVMGKLVPRHLMVDKDTTAKNSTTRSGLIEANTLPDVRVDEVPFKLPEFWSWVRLGCVTNFGRYEKVSEIAENTWVLDLEDIEKSTSRVLKKVRFSERRSKSDKNSFLAGDVLYGKLRPYLNKVVIADEDGVCTTEIAPLRVVDGLFSGYLKVCLMSPMFLDFVNRKSYGVKMPRLGTKDGQMALIPLPPLAEQHRIVAKVDELMALCDKLEGQQNDSEAAHSLLVKTLLDTLTQSQDADDFAASWARIKENFHTLFTTEESVDILKQAILQLALMGKLVPQDPKDEPASELLRKIDNARKRLNSTVRKTRHFEPLPAEPDNIPTLPIGWCLTNISSVASVIDPNPSHRMPRYVPQGIPFISTENFSQNDTIDFSIGKCVDEETLKEQIDRFEIPDGAFALTRIGTIGKTRILPTKRNYCLSHALCVIAPFINELDSSFLRLVVSAESVFSGARLGIKSIGVPDLGLGIIRSILIPLPPLGEQHRICAKVDELMGVCENLKSDIQSSRRLQEYLSSGLLHTVADRKVLEGAESTKRPTCCIGVSAPV